MTMEADLVSLLRTVCPQVHPDAAPLPTTPRPFVVWQLIGGQALRHMDNSASAQRMSYVQVSAWSHTRAESLTMIRSIEDVLCASSLFVARPNAEPIADLDEDLALYGAVQDFTVVASR